MVSGSTWCWRVGALQVDVFNVSSGPEPQSRNRLEADPVHSRQKQSIDQTQHELEVCRFRLLLLFFFCPCSFVIAVSISPRNGKMIKLFVAVVGS
jgi:hypothetical protein